MADFRRIVTVPKELSFVLLFVTLGAVLSVRAQVYAGFMGGVAALSGASNSTVGVSSSFVSYDPKNGPVFEVLAGKHLSDYFTLQGEYVWNSNTLTVTSAEFSNGMQRGYSETRGSTQQSVIADLMVYFRKRSSRLRPFLAVGTGFVHFSSSREQLTSVIGNPILPPQQFSSNRVVLHVPVGIDVRLSKGWAFRYSFSESLSSNPVTTELSPPSTRKLQNFQNLFGFLYAF